MSKIHLRELRLETHKLLLRLMRSMTVMYISSNRYEGPAQDVILCSAIFIGQAERKPFNATKLSHYTGIPRPTVIRRLKELERMGFVIKTSKRCYCLPREIINHPEVLERWSGIFKDIQVFVEVVSKMDSPEVAAENISNIKRGADE